MIRIIVKELVQVVVTQLVLDALEGVEELVLIAVPLLVLVVPELVLELVLELVRQVVQTIAPQDVIPGVKVIVMRYVETPVL